MGHTMRCARWHLGAVFEAVNYGQRWRTVVLSRVNCTPLATRLREWAYRGRMATLVAAARPVALVGRPAAPRLATSRGAGLSCQPIHVAPRTALTRTPQTAPVQTVRLGHSTTSKARCASAAAAAAAASVHDQPRLEAVLQATAVEAEELSKVCS